MRKIITSTVLILLFSLFSSTVIADVSDCKEVKGQKALYGLCVAYWNANPKQQAKFLAKFDKKSGGMPMPGTELPVEEDPIFPDENGDEQTEVVVCPCWANGEIDYPVQFGWLPDFGGVDGTIIFAWYEFSQFQFNVEPNFCSYGNQLGGFEVDRQYTTSDAEDEACVADMVEIIARDF